MNPAADKHGYFLEPDPALRLAWPRSGPRFWLRLAHRFTLTHETASGRGQVRRLRDHELLLQEHGASWIWCERSAGCVALPAGSVAFIPPDWVHAWGETAGTHIAVHFDLEANPELRAMAMLEPLGRTVDAGPRVPSPTFALGRARAPGLSPIVPLVTPVRAPKAWQRRLGALVQLSRAKRQRTPAGDLAVAETLSWALSTLEQDARALVGRTRDDPRARIERLLGELGTAAEDHSLKVADLASRVGMSETAFRAAFQRVTGRLPRRYLEELRIESAARWLLETELPVHRVAEAVGYPDPFHFSRAFKRVIGVGPRRYRRASHRVHPATRRPP